MRSPKTILSLALAGLALVAAAAATPPEAEAAPNVVVVMTDDQDVRSLRVMPQVRRKLVRQGTLFSTNFATTPVCCPSRATYLTGQYAHNHGVIGKDPEFQTANYRQFDDQGSLPVALQGGGYRTGYIGKYLNGYGDGPSNPREVPQGWDRWYAPVQGSATKQFDYTLNQNGDLKRYGSKRRDYQTDRYGRLAERFISQSAKRNEPFFLTVAPSAPHGERGVRETLSNPRPAPRHRRAFRNEKLPESPSFNERKVRDKPSFIRRLPRLGRKDVRALTKRHQDRLASLLAVDDAVADIHRRLRRTGELGNTVIVFTSDNGYLEGQHRITGKLALYEESAQVPLVISGPGFPEGEKHRQITANIDLAPTILAETGAEPLRVMDGIPLGSVAVNPDRGASRDILLENSLSNGVRNRRYAYYEHPKGEEELYDLRRDRFQLESEHRGQRYGDVRERLSERLAELEACEGAGCQ